MPVSHLLGVSPLLLCTMNNIVPFDFDGNAVRVITDDAGAPWFVAADVCAALGISRTDDGVSRLDDDEKGTGSIRTPGGDQQMTTVNESGLYSLVLGSRKPEAKRFKKWVTSEVLPTIRKTGAYAVAGVAPTGDELKLSLLESAVRRGLVSAPAAESAALRIIGVDAEPIPPTPVPEQITTPTRVAAVDTKLAARRASRASLFALKPSLTLSAYGKNRTALPTLRVSLEEAAEWIDEGQVVMLVVMCDKGYIDANRAPTAKARNLHDKHGWKLKSLLGALGLPV